MDEPDIPEAPDWWKQVLWFWHHLRINRDDFVKAPVLGAIFVAAGLGYSFAGHQDKERLDLAADRGSFLADQLAAYKDRLQGASPDEAAKQVRALQARLEKADQKLQLLMPECAPPFERQSNKSSQRREGRA